MTTLAPVMFTKLNEGWNAEPNAPEATVLVRDETVVLEFYANAFVFSEYAEDERLRLVFEGATRYRMGPTNDEGWWRGQCRFGRAAPAWGEFYELLGDLSSVHDPGDWISLAAPSAATRHFLFYLRDETFECSAATWHVERGLIEPTQSDA
jgi:hypothetical protein